MLVDNSRVICDDSRGSEGSYGSRHDEGLVENGQGRRRGHDKIGDTKEGTGDDVLSK